MISDGIMPSNEGRGYVLRRIIRRSSRQGRKLGVQGTFLANLSNTVIEGSKDGYPELEEKKEFIFNVLTEEENKFNKTIDQYKYSGRNGRVHDKGRRERTFR